MEENLRGLGKDNSVINLNAKQIISIAGAILGVLMISTSQLTDLFGAGTAKTVTSVAALVNTILSSVMAVITSQGSTVKEVLAMPGVDKIDVNARANPTLAAIAVDPTINNISPTVAAMDKVTATAKGE